MNKYTNKFPFSRGILPFLLVLTIFLSVSLPVYADEEQKQYIKWVDFTPSAAALRDCAKADTERYGSDRHYPWYLLLALLSARTGGSYKAYRTATLDKLLEALDSGKAPEELTGNEKLYNYYLKAYSAVLSGMLGEYIEEKQNDAGETIRETKYGLYAANPIAAGYYYNDYDDFGNARSFGFARKHQGHDMLGNVGTPIIAVEGGYVEACGWNAYGGWRVGIRSYDGKRYYYYAHLRKNHPYNDIYEGKTVRAGEVIGYLGMTGYSTKENTNNINVPHLHFGMQIIFDKSQKDGNNQIWIDVYEITKFLSANRIKTHSDEESGERYSNVVFISPNEPD